MPETEKFLSDIQSESADLRFAAWRAAGEVDPRAIPDLGKLAASDKPGVRKAAVEALSTMAHAVGQETGTPKRSEVVKKLIELAGGDYAPSVRAVALRQLSLIAGDDAVPSIKWVDNPDLREEVAFCLERIPGKASIKALMAYYREARDDFKPRVLAALGHRRAEEALGLVMEAMRSPNKEIAMAGMKAFGRIGKKPAAAPRFPDPAGLSEWQKTEHMDSQLRYADAQTAQGNHAEAMKVYKAALGRKEEHWQCAGIVGIARMGTPEAAAALFPLLKSSNRTVRITAQNVWKAMAKTAGEKA
ncbi:MAG: hypothetical protein HYR60_26665, partial [Acidobacteria bacterium]|nr:hypothetical protein [Acidobacteriota bacterium]